MSIYFYLLKYNLAFLRLLAGCSFEKIFTGKITKTLNYFKAPWTILFLGATWSWLLHWNSFGKSSSQFEAKLPSNLVPLLFRSPFTFHPFQALTAAK